MADEARTAISRQSNRRRKKQPETGSTNGSSEFIPSATERPAAAEPRDKGVELRPEPRAVLSPDTKNLADAVREIVRPLQDMLEREIAERRTLQAQTDQLLAKLAATQAELAEAKGTIDIGHARWEAAESRAAEAVAKVVAAEAKVEAAHAKAIELQRRIEALRLELAQPPKRRWWPF